MRGFLRRWLGLESMEEDLLEIEDQVEKLEERIEELWDLEDRVSDLEAARFVKKKK